MHTLLIRLGRTDAAAFMAFALVAIAQGAVCVAALGLSPAAPVAAATQA